MSPWRYFKHTTYTLASSCRSVAVKKLPGIAAARESLTEACFLSLVADEVPGFPGCSGAVPSLPRSCRSDPTRRRPSRELPVPCASIFELKMQRGTEGTCHESQVPRSLRKVGVDASTPVTQTSFNGDSPRCRGFSGTPAQSPFELSSLQPLDDPVDSVKGRTRQEPVQRISKKLRLHRHGTAVRIFILDRLPKPHPTEVRH